MMNPCNEPRMSDPAWRDWLARHPRWHAPAIAPCGGAAARTWLRRAAIGLGGVAGAAGIGAGVAPIMAAAVDPAGGPPASLTAAAYVTPVSVPEPGSLGLLLIAVAMLAVVALVARRRRV